MNNHSNNSNARALSSIRALFKFLNLNNLILNTQIFKIKNPKISKKLPKSVAFDDVKKIILEIENYRKYQWEIDRDIAILFLIFFCNIP